MIGLLQQSEAENFLYYAYIGALATQFVAMEMVLTDAARRLGASDKDLSVSFNELRKALQQGLRREFGVIVAEGEEARRLIKKIEEAGKGRNDILHSAWSAFQDGQVTQHRVRPKDKSLPLIAKYDKHQLTEIEAVIYEVMELRSEIPYWLDVFEERTMSESGKGES